MTLTREDRIDLADEMARRLEQSGALKPDTSEIECSGSTCSCDVDLYDLKEMVTEVKQSFEAQVDRLEELLQKYHFVLKAEPPKPASGHCDCGLGCYTALLHHNDGCSLRKTP